VTVEEYAPTALTVTATDVEELVGVAHVPSELDHEYEGDEVTKNSLVGKDGGVADAEAENELVFVPVAHTVPFGTDTETEADEAFAKLMEAVKHSTASINTKNSRLFIGMKDIMFTGLSPCILNYYPVRIIDDCR
jgi:hypothetical protein